MEESLTIDMDDLTLGEIEDIEEQLGLTFDQLQRMQAKSGLPIRVVTTLVWVMKRRDDPAFTLEQARATKVRQLTPGAGTEEEATAGPPA